MQALVEQWIEFSTLNIDAPLSSWVYPLLGFMDYDKKVCPVLVVTFQNACMTYDYGST